MVSLLAGKTGRAPRANAPRTVDVLTAYCADEPSEMVVNTLHAIQRIRYPHTTYLCDEADDAYLRGGATTSALFT